MNKIYSNFDQVFDFEKIYKEYEKVSKEDIIRVSQKLKYLTYCAII